MHFPRHSWVDFFEQAYDIRVIEIKTTKCYKRMNAFPYATPSDSFVFGCSLKVRSSNRQLNSETIAPMITLLFWWYLYGIWEGSVMIHMAVCVLHSFGGQWKPRRRSSWNMLFMLANLDAECPLSFYHGSAACLRWPSSYRIFFGVVKLWWMRLIQFLLNPALMIFYRIFLTWLLTMLAIFHKVMWD